MKHMPQAILPKFLQPKKIEKLVRVGQDCDGGYLIDERSWSNSELLIGLGMGDDWSFEQQFIEKNKIPIYMVDGTVRKKDFIQNMFKELVHLNPFIVIPQVAHWLKVFLRYKKFFQGDRHHLKNLIGWTSTSNTEWISLSDLITKKIPDSSAKIFLKVDIEGAEYRLLEDLIRHADNLEGLVIEFHDLDIHLDRVKKFIKKFPLHLCHVHVNNFGPLQNEEVPLVIECTFTKYSIDGMSVDDFPHPFDRPNDSKRKDYALSFK